ncbi:MAG: peptidoglycan-binding protein [Gemmatimonadaceae bacterium]
MRTTTLAVLAIAAMPVVAVAQDTTSRGGQRDTTAAGNAGGNVGAQTDTSRMGAQGETQRTQTESGRRMSSGPSTITFTPERVAQLQSALTSAGCDAGKPDGVVGPKTRRALACARQKNNVTTNEELYQSLNLNFSSGGGAGVSGTEQGMRKSQSDSAVSSPSSANQPSANQPSANQPGGVSPGAATDTSAAQATHGDSAQVGGQNRGRVRPPEDSTRNVVPGNPPPSGTTPPPSGTTPAPPPLR